jgi:hypothetical protein
LSARLVGEVFSYLNSGAGDKLTPAERLVLAAIAERARDSTRQAWQGGEDDWQLSRIVGVRLPDVLERLARHGLDVRISLGTDSRGRVVYAHRGRQASFVLPPLLPVDKGSVQTDSVDNSEEGSVPAEPNEKGSVEPEPSNEKGSVPAEKGSVPAEKGSVPAEKGSVQADPYLSESLRRPQNPSINVGADDPWTAIGACSEEKTIILKKIQTQNPKIGNLGAYVATMHRNGDLAAMLADHRRDQKAHHVRNELAAIRRMEPCEHGEAGGNQLHPLTGQALCPVCRDPQLAEQLAERERTERGQEPEQYEPHPDPTRVGNDHPSARRSPRRSSVAQLLTDPDPAPRRRPMPPGSGCCITCAEHGQLVAATDPVAGSYCHTHTSRSAAA